jgi:hypothetical protein
MLMFPSFRKVSDAVEVPPHPDSELQMGYKFDYGPSLIVEEKSDIVHSPIPDRARRNNVSAMSNTLNYVQSERSISVQSSPEVKQLQMENSESKTSLRLQSGLTHQEKPRESPTKVSHSISTRDLPNKLNSPNRALNISTLT